MISIYCGVYATTFVSFMCGYLAKVRAYDYSLKYSRRDNKSSNLHSFCHYILLHSKYFNNLKTLDQYKIIYTAYKNKLDSKSQTLDKFYN
jgi:hypothetical protein